MIIIPPIIILIEIFSLKNNAPTSIDISNSKYLKGAKNEAFANEKALSMQNKIKLAPIPRIKNKPRLFESIPKNSVPGIRDEKIALNKLE